MRSASTTLGYLRPVLRLLESLGHDIKRLLEIHGLSADSLNDVHIRVPVTLSRAWMSLAEERVPIPLWRALLKHTHYHDFGGLGRALEAGGSPAQVLQRLATYHALVSDAARLTIQHTANGCRLSMIPDALTPPHRQSMLYLVALLLHFCRVRGVTPFRATMVGIPGLLQEEKNALSAFFELAIVDADNFRIEFAGTSRAVQLKHSDGDIAQSMEPVLQQRLFVHQRPLAAQIQQWLRQNMADSNPRLQSVARAMHMSERSLQRRLRIEGLTWRQLVETTRQQVMTPMLAVPGMPITDVALTLGYSHATSFSRAFRRRHGITPRHYRKQRAQVSDRPA